MGPIAGQSKPAPWLLAARDGQSWEADSVQTTMYSPSVLESMNFPSVLTSISEVDPGEFGECGETCAGQPLLHSQSVVGTDDAEAGTMWSMDTGGNKGGLTKSFSAPDLHQMQHNPTLMGKKAMTIAKSFAPAPLFWAHILDSRKVRGITFYTVKVARGKETWTIEKRYSDFVRLDNALEAAGSGLSRESLPERGWLGFKKVFKCGGIKDARARRMQGLNHYLQNLIQQSRVSSQQRPRHLTAFLAKQVQVSK